MTSYLLSVQEVGDLLGVTRQRADQLSKLPNFPRPEATLTNGRVWNREAVITWCLVTGRLKEHPDATG